MAATTPIVENKPVNSETTYSTIDPEIYVVRSNIQRALNLQVLDLLQGSFMNDTKEQQFLDVGCGTGDFTRDHLLPRCTPLRRMVAVDVSEDMVEYAKKNFAHPKICYDVLDISGNGVAYFVKRYGRAIKKRYSRTSPDYSNQVEDVCYFSELQQALCV
ncbi:hypothetical protein HPB47_006131 [Ixodes persulcatus]|uniref:Uncharacterized protein n=2 Tax=Ixodes persulcatus TaxID=34615 RepID=A0AC60PB50_IXOPE|nr:hypothetical protein HPB47_006130 [Ixodes persulcatus]KAG0416790.1 hypothetical protein HPB47_006131 [Ixodes persulcatus]